MWSPKTAYYVSSPDAWCLQPDLDSAETCDHEPLGSSDEVRRGGIMQLLRIELSQYFKQVLLVSFVEGREQDVTWYALRLDESQKKSSKGPGFSFLQQSRL